MNVAGINLAGVQIQGNLLPPDMTSLLLSGSVKGQTPEDFGFGKNEKLADEIATVWGDAKAYWTAFQRALARLDDNDPATTITREQWAVPLLRSLGYEPVYTAKAEVVEGQTYAISHRAEAGENKPPIHIVGCRLEIDKRPPSGMPRLSPHALVQEYLNGTEHLWAIATNGYRWRLLRDSSLMTRLTYIEFDLEQILGGENFAEFGLFYRLFHRSRLPQGMDDADKCLLEFYHQEALQQGGRVRDRLRDGVEKALKQLGTGFLQHPRNEHLRQKLANGKELSELGYYRQLLRLIYRLLFLMVAESRNLLLTDEDPEKARIYREYYSIERLRELAERSNWRREGFQDVWQGLRVTFQLFDENWRGQLLGLSPLNSDLFGSNTLADLDDCGIDNYDLLGAIRHLSLYQADGQIRRVNYAALDVEELGSVYESLLEFHPQIGQRQGIYAEDAMSEVASDISAVRFDLVFGSERKTTGSYYTPPSLVQQLIKTALEPVIEEKLKETKQKFSHAKNSTGDSLRDSFASRSSACYPDSQRINSLSESESPLKRTSAISKDAVGEVASPTSAVRHEIDFIASQEAALLSIKVCDPACGSGHFLLAAARRIGKELAKVRTNEAQPGVEPIRQAIRDVIQHCIYGVDFNPLAVDLCKVALWIEGFNRGKPLSFLDHRIKCGNSLVGVLDLDCLTDGIPDDAYKAVTGDSKQLATDLKKRNKKERGEKDQFLIGENLEEVRSHYAQTAKTIGAIAENTTGDVKNKQTQYRQSRQDAGWWRDRSACNLWTAAFFTPLAEQNLQLLPTTAALSRLLRELEVANQELAEDLAMNFQTRSSESLKPIENQIDSLEETSIIKQGIHSLAVVDGLPSLTGEDSAIKYLANISNLLKQTENQLDSLEKTSAIRQGIHSLADIIDAANKLAESKRFFHWALEFPEVFENGGFSCVLGNPPWELLQIAEKEFFASRNAEIANAANKAAREKLIKQLSQTSPQLLQEFEEAKHDAEAQSKFIRESSRFPLTAVGKINTYAVFAETTRKIISSNGTVGIIVPTGIATDDTCKKFFGDLTQRQNLASLYDFENREAIFSAVHRSYKFSLLGMSNQPIAQANFSFFLTQPKQLDGDRILQLSPQDIALINPNTLTCPVFRSRTDAELTKKIYQRVPVLENENTGKNSWGISFMRMFDMSSDSGLFKYEAGDGLVPLYQAKMFHQFDHRWATYTDDGNTRDLTEVEKSDLNYQVISRYWVDKKEVENRLGDWKKNWLLAFRGICRATDERSAILSIIPKFGLGHSAPVIILGIDKANLVSCLQANLSSLVFDFVTRQKLGGTNFSFFIVKQLPVIPPETYIEEDIKFISTRVLELVYTSWDMQSFAKDMGYEGEPFIWDEQRRALLRAELDAYYAKLYGLTRDELRYILDPADVYGEDFPSETFRVLKNKEINKYGEYQTQRLVLEAWDRMFG
jgi:hypothetical protein